MRTILLWLFGLILVQADLPPYKGGGTLAFEWEGLDRKLAEVPDTQASLPSPTRLHLEYTGKGPVVYTLRVIGPAFVSHFSSKHYAIDGHTRYENLPDGSFLELENWFAPDRPGAPEKFYYSRTLAEAGPMSKLEGTDDGRDFSLPFDATGATTPLVRLVLKLHLAGPGAIDLYGVRMSQYPEPAAASAAPPATPTASPVQSVASVDRKSFALGAVATLGALMGAFVLFASVRGWQRLRHARELRRIASLDG